MLYEIGKIKAINLELTTNCNAMCSACIRWKDGGLNPVVEKNLGSKGHISLEVLSNIYCDELAQSEVFKRFELNGTVGDAINSPYLVDFVKMVRDKSKKFGKVHGPEIDLHTNGALHSTQWWADFAHIMNENNPNSQVIFALDGTDNETHQQYRKGCDYNKVLENAVSYINAGGKAIWQFIEFEHNKHQYEEAKSLCNELGFDSFYLKNNRGASEKIVSARHHTQFKNKDAIANIKDIDVNVNNKMDTKTTKRIKVETKEKLTYTVENSIDKQIEQSTKEVFKKYKSEEDYLSNDPITCEWGTRGELNIEWNGLVHPCCHMNVGMYKNYDKVYDNLTNIYTPDFWMVTETNTLKDVLDHEFWKDLEKSWQPDNNPDRKFKRLKACKESCITKELNLRNANKNLFIDKAL